MAKKIILTETQLKRISSLINEDFDSHIYDLILDKYNEVGLEEMDEDEVAYLKSGGETEIPLSFKEPEKNYDLGFGDEDSDEETQVRELSEIIAGRNMETLKSDTHFAMIINFEQPVYDEIIRIFGGKETKDNYGNVIKIMTKGNKIIVAVPLSWEDKIFGEDIQ